MPFRVACPECGAALTLPDAVAGTVVRCPKCRAPMEAPEPARPARDDRDDEDDRPRRPRRRKAKAGGGFPVWAGVLLGVLAVGAAGAGVYFAARGKGGAGGGPAAGGGAPAGGGVKYVPRESEKKYEALSREKGDAPITEAEVLATMGEPTRRGPVVRGQKDGVPFTIQEWEWKVSGSGIESSMDIVNGVAAGQVIGLEVTPRDRGGPRPGGD